MSFLKWFLPARHVISGKQLNERFSFFVMRKRLALKYCQVLFPLSMVGHVFDSVPEELVNLLMLVMLIWPNTRFQQRDVSNDWVGTHRGDTVAFIHIAMQQYCYVICHLNMFGQYNKINVFYYYFEHQINALA